VPKSKGPSPRDHNDGTRSCIVCASVYPLEQYDKDQNAALGRRARCKPCRGQQMKDWYAANRERQAQRQSDRFKSNREAIREQDLKRYYKHRDKRIALVIDASHRRRAAKSAVESDRGITVMALRKRDGDACCYCSQTMTFERGNGRTFVPLKATIEHVLPLSRGGSHTWENVALACWQCNVYKNAKTTDEWQQTSGSAA
jgi:5-methylcytosine-specific restriction endonuclease McrA